MRTRSSDGGTLILATTQLVRHALHRRLQQPILLFQILYPRLHPHPPSTSIVQIFAVAVQTLLLTLEFFLIELISSPEIRDYGLHRLLKLLYRLVHALITSNGSLEHLVPCRRFLDLVSSELLLQAITLKADFVNRDQKLVNEVRLPGLLPSQS